MKNYITIDGGTTNTRVSLVSDLQILAVKKSYAVPTRLINKREGLKQKLQRQLKVCFPKINLPKDI